MKKWTSFIACLLCLSLLLSACSGCQGSGDDGAPGATTTAPGSGSQAATTPSATETTLPATTPVQTTLPATTPQETTLPETTPAETTIPETTPAPTQPSGGSSPGGTGGFEGGSTTPVTPKPEELTVPEVGSEGNPFAESVASLPDRLSTVNIPAGGKVSYLISGLAGNWLQIADENASVILDGTTYTAENGIVTVNIPASADNAPVLLQLVNLGDQERPLTLDLTPAVGSQANPQVISDISQLNVQIAPGQSSYYYSWTPSEPGVLTLVVDEVTPEGATAAVTITNAGATSTTDETGTHLDVIAGEEVIICVTVEQADQAQAKLTGTFEASLGTQSNPIPIVDVDQPFTATVAGESVVYYRGNLAAMTLTMLGYEDVVLMVGEDVVTLDGDGNIIYTFPEGTGGRPEPIVFALKNTCDTETSYQLNFTHPVGSLMNPAQLILGENSATVSPDNGDGYNYTWTATEDGILTISMYDSNWQYVINNLTAGIYGDMMDAAMEPSVAETVLEVSKGDEITLSVNGFNPEDPWALPGGTVNFSAMLSKKPGHRENPIAISDLSQSFVTTIPAETTYYYTGLLFDVGMEAYDAYGLELSTTEDDAYDENGYFFYHFPAYDGAGRPQPITFCLSNATGEDATYTLHFIFPVGTPQNPGEMILGENTAQVEADNADGYIYNWTATANGELTVTMDGTGWSYTVSNLTAGTYGDTHTSGDDPVVAAETIVVSEGDQIQVIVNTYDPESYSTPAGSVAFTASLLEPDLGTEANPEKIMGQFPIDTQKMLPGTSRYYDVYGCSGMIISTNATITVNGEAYDGGVLNVGRGEAVRLVVINDTHASNRFLIRFEFPKGHPENPDALKLGANSVTLAAGNENGHTYTWTASANGTLVVAMSSGGWQYVLSNETAGTIGDQLDSSVATAAISKLEVKAGDKISLNVNAFDAADPWNYHGGSVSFTASFSENQLAMEILADETASGKEVVASSGDLAKGGKAYLVISAVTDKASGKSVAYAVNGTEADSGQLLTVSTSVATEWAIAQESGEEVEVAYAVIYVYENLPVEPEGTEPEGTQPEETQPEETQPEETQPEETQPEGTESEGTQPEGTQPEETQPEA